MHSYQEQNAKAEQIGAGIALGCVGIPFILFMLALMFYIIFPD